MSFESMPGDHHSYYHPTQSRMMCRYVTSQDKKLNSSAIEAKNNEIQVNKLLLVFESK